MITSATARSSRSAASFSLRCRSISAPDRIRAVGLTLFCPLYLGALPCVASKTAPSGPILAPGATPSPPTRPATQVAQDVAVQVGQHEHVVQFRLLHELHAHVVDDAVFELDVRELLGHLAGHGQEQPVGVLEDVGLVDGGDLLAAIGPGVLEGVRTIRSLPEMRSA